MGRKGTSSDAFVSRRICSEMIFHRRVASGSRTCHRPRNTGFLNAQTISAGVFPAKLGSVRGFKKLVACVETYNHCILIGFALVSAVETVPSLPIQIIRPVQLNFRAC